MARDSKLIKILPVVVGEHDESFLEATRSVHDYSIRCARKLEETHVSSYLNTESCPIFAGRVFVFEMIEKAANSAQGIQPQFGSRLVYNLLDDHRIAAKFKEECAITLEPMKVIKYMGEFIDLVLTVAKELCAAIPSCKGGEVPKAVREALSISFTGVPIPENLGHTTFDMIMKGLCIACEPIAEYAREVIDDEDVHARLFAIQKVSTLRFSKAVYWHKPVVRAPPRLHELLSKSSEQQLEEEPRELLEEQAKTETKQAKIRNELIQKGVTSVADKRRLPTAQQRLMDLLNKKGDENSILETFLSEFLKNGPICITTQMVRWIAQMCHVLTKMHITEDVDIEALLTVLLSDREATARWFGVTLQEITQLTPENIDALSAKGRAMFTGVMKIVANTRRQHLQQADGQTAATCSQLAVVLHELVNAKQETPEQIRAAQMATVSYFYRMSMAERYPLYEAVEAALRTTDCFRGLDFFQMIDVIEMAFACLQIRAEEVDEMATKTWYAGFSADGSVTRRVTKLAETILTFVPDGCDEKFESQRKAFKVRIARGFDLIQESYNEQGKAIPCAQLHWVMSIKRELYEREREHLFDMPRSELIRRAELLMTNIMVYSHMTVKEAADIIQISDKPPYAVDMSDKQPRLHVPAVRLEDRGENNVYGIHYTSLEYLPFPGHRPGAPGPSPSDAPLYPFVPGLHGDMPSAIGTPVLPRQQAGGVHGWGGSVPAQPPGTTVWAPPVQGVLQQTPLTAITPSSMPCGHMPCAPSQATQGLPLFLASVPQQQQQGGQGQGGQGQGHGGHQGGGQVRGRSPYRRDASVPGSGNGQARTAGGHSRAGSNGGWQGGHKGGAGFSRGQSPRSSNGLGQGRGSASNTPSHGPHKLEFDSLSFTCSLVTY